MAPAGTPNDIIALLQREIVQGAGGAGNQGVAAWRSAATPSASTPDEFAALIKTKFTFWATLIRAANIKMP